ncbi:MAG TPA: glycosyltransferase [Candidatus Udaeobacter sp.]|nr:glycosyltransferase [Candidatus Udaeobacter sp.]
MEEIGEVSVIVLDAEHGKDGWDNFRDRGFDLVDVIPVRQHSNRGIHEKLRWAFDPRSDHPQGQSVGPEGTDRVLRQIEKYDLIWFSKIRSASMLAQLSWPRSVLDLDDVPSVFETSVLQNGGSIPHKLMTGMRRWSWRRREKLLEERFTTLAVCSEKDKCYLQSLGINTPIHVIPNGFEEPIGIAARTPATPCRIGFIGIFDYYPNVEGIEWFVRNCWPKIKTKCPDVKLRLAGRFSNGSLQLAAKDIEPLGWVENIDDEVATWSLMIVPLHKGAGTRGKIAFGFSRCCPIVSTSLGAYGYEVETGREILLADDPGRFAEACLTILEKPQDGASMAQRAHEKFLANWTWKAIQPRVWAAADDCLRRSANEFGLGRRVASATK